jgi:hypothetical protein
MVDAAKAGQPGGRVSRWLAAIGPRIETFSTDRRTHVDGADETRMPIQEIELSRRFPVRKLLPPTVWKMDKARIGFTPDRSPD